MIAMRSNAAVVAAAVLGVVVTAPAPTHGQSALAALRQKVRAEHRQAGRAETAAAGEVSPEVSPAPVTGTFEVTFHITFKTAFPKGSGIRCYADFAAASVNASTGAIGSWREENFGYVAVSGSTATCTVSIPYSWALPASSATVTNSLFEGTYDVLGVEGTTAATVVGERTSSGDLIPVLGNVPIPANGTITKYTVAVTL